jgi:purine-binding chemotaxis protein CheW
VTSSIIVAQPASLRSQARRHRGDRAGGAGADLSFLGFTLESEEYGADLNLVTQIVKPPPLTWVPRVRPHVLGVIAIRGAVVTLVDLRQLIGLGPTSWPRTARVLLTSHGGEPIGLLVDGVTHVHRVSVDQFETGLALEESARTECVLGIARPDPSTRVTIVDVVGILAELLR